MHSNPLMEVLLLWASHWARQFERLAEKPVETQQRVLLAKLRKNQNSRFGREHHFDSVRSVRDFQNAVPVTDYEYLRPYIDQCIAGNPSALFGDRTRIHMYALTSGTHAQPKHIPVTTEFLNEYQKGWRVWGVATHRDHPEAFAQRVMQVTSSWRESHTPLGVPCGSISGLNAQMQPRVFRSRFLPGLVIHELGDSEAKYYVTARLTLDRRISMICTANPSSVLSVVRCIEQNADDLIRDIRDGGLKEDLEIPETVRKRIAGLCRPNAPTAKRLEKMISRTGWLRPTDYWPDLRVLANWKGGTVGLYLNDYPRYFGSLPIRDIGLLATEGRLTIPMSSEGAGGVLDLGSQFFEFIPIDQLDKPEPETLLPHQVQTGSEYGVLITTSSGLYRYNIGDIVRVNGFWRKTPVVTFLNKGQHVSNMTGEKLTEHQVVEALTALSGQPGNLTAHVLISPQWGNPPTYTVTIEGDSTDKSEWATALGVLDRRLAELNMEYHSRRESGRLGPLTLNLVAPGTFDRMRERHLERVGGRREQYKHVYLVPKVDFHRELEAVELT